MRLNSRIVVVTVLLTSSIALADGPELIKNGGFEVGIGSDASSWTHNAGGALSMRAAIQPASGTYALRIAGSHGSGSAFQRVNSGIVDGNPFRFSASVAAEDEGGNIYCQVAFFDAANQLVGDPFRLDLSPATLTASHQLFTMQDLVPAGATWAQVGAGINGLVGVPGDARFDEISLAMVPEPATATIILAIAVVSRRRQR